MMIPHGTPYRDLPVTLMNFAKFMSTGPILTIKLIVRLVEHIFFSFFKYGGGQGAQSTFRSDGMIFSLIFF